MSVAMSRAPVQSAIALGAWHPHIHEGSFIMKGLILAISLFLTLYSLSEGSVSVARSVQSKSAPYLRLWKWLLRLPAREVKLLGLPVNS